VVARAGPGGGGGGRKRAGPDDRQGAVWAVRAGHVVVHLPETSGIGYLAQLLHNPRRDIAAVVLAAGAGSAPAAADTADAQMPTGRTPSSPPPRRPTGDGSANWTRRSTRRRNGWPGYETNATRSSTRSLSLRARRAASAARLRGRTGSGQRHVTRAIRTAIRNVAAQAPELGAYLDARVRTGARCRYDPPD
jgi:hypothetical protein